MTVIETGDSFLGELMKVGQIAAGTHATVIALGTEMRGFAEGTNRRLESLEKRMSTTETKDGIQGHAIEDLEKQIASQGAAIRKLNETIQQMKIQIAVYSAGAAFVGAIIMAIVTEYLLPLLIGV